MKMPSVAGTTTEHEPASMSRLSTKESQAVSLCNAWGERKRHSELDGFLSASVDSMSGDVFKQYIWHGHVERPRRSRFDRGLFHPHAVDDASPDICQSTQRHTVRLALRELTLVVFIGPRFTQGRLPRELLQMVPQQFQTSRALVRFRIIPTLVWCVSAQSRPTYHIVVASFQTNLLGVSGPYITGAQSSDPLIID
jgi:hypothetical protein